MVIPRSDQYMESADCPPDSSMPAKSYGHRNANSFSRSAVTDAAYSSQIRPYQAHLNEVGEDAHSEPAPRQIHNATYHSEAPNSGHMITDDNAMSLRSKDLKSAHMHVVEN